MSVHAQMWEVVGVVNHILADAVYAALCRYGRVSNRGINEQVSECGHHNKLLFLQLIIPKAKNMSPVRFELATFRSGVAAKG